MLRSQHHCTTVAFFLTAYYCALSIDCCHAIVIKSRTPTRRGRTLPLQAILQRSGEDGGRRVFVRGVAFSADTEAFAAEMAQFGDVSDVWLAPDTGRPEYNRGFGGATFVDVVAVSRAMETAAKGELKLMGRRLRVERHYEQDRSPLSSQSDRSLLLTQLRSAKRKSHVASLLQKFSPRDAKEYSMAVSAWGRVRQWKQAVELLSEMKRHGVEPDVITYNAAISACAKGKQWKHALGLLSEMRERGLEPNVITYSAAMSACEKGSQWERALELLQEMHNYGIEPNVITYSAALSACAKGSQSEHALELLSEMRERGVEPNVITYSAAMSACAKGSQWERALELLNDMRSRGVEPNVITYSAAISACGKASQWERALGLLSEMRRRGVAPDVITFNALISACDKGSQWEHALELMQVMHNYGIEPNVITYSAAISACENGLQWERALELLSEMRERGLEPNVITYSAAVSACAKGSQWERALGLLSDMRSYGLEPNVITYSAAISACEKGMQWERALELLSEMKSHGVEPDVITYNAAISACEKGSKWERALELLREMRDCDIKPNVISYSAAISACEKGSQWEHALELLSETRERGLEPNVISYSAAISACGKGSQWESALELLSEMRERGPEPTLATFNAAMQALVASGGANLDDGIALLQDVESAGLASDPDAYAIHRSLLVACQLADDTDRAKRVMELMEQHGVSRGARASASTVIRGRLSEFSNEIGDARSDAAMMDLLTEVASKSPYEVQFDALPIGFLDSSTTGQQKRSLRHHAEKKALAELLARGCDALEIGVNFHMCVDCHEFFKGASKLLGRRIEVREPSVLHIFDDGGCSCNDQWRWEARFVSSQQQQLRDDRPREGG